MGVTEYNTQVDAVVAAIDSGDAATARKALRMARVLLAGIPDTKIGDMEIKYRPAGLDGLESVIDSIETEGAGIARNQVQYSKLRHNRPGLGD